MPKAKLTDEQKEEAFQTWLQTPEVQSIDKFIEKRAICQPPLDMGIKDVSYDMQPFLTALWQMVQDLKVPGRKAKARK